MGVTLESLNRITLLRNKMNCRTDAEMHERTNVQDRRSNIRPLWQRERETSGGFQRSRICSWPRPVIGISPPSPLQPPIYITCVYLQCEQRTRQNVMRERSKLHLRREMREERCLIQSGDHKMYIYRKHIYIFL
jgi:hypothetical protein